MSAHFLPVSHQCQTEGCTRIAAGQVRTSQNEVVGEFCRRCGEAMVARINTPVPADEQDLSPKWATRLYPLK